MHRIHRAIVILPALALALAACSSNGSGAGGSDEPTTEPMASAPAATGSMAATSPTPSGSGMGGDEASEARVDMATLATDPSTYADQEVTVLARVDELLADGDAFLTSPSATDEDQLLVVLTDDARVDDDLEVGNVAFVDGTVVAIDDLESAGADLSADDEALADYDGDYAIVADGIRDPLSD